MFNPPVYFSDKIMPRLAAMLLQQPPIHIGEWQSTDVSTSRMHSTYETTDMTFLISIPDTRDQLVAMLGEDLNRDWAEEHFQERIGGIPLNPPPSHVRWPWARHNGNHQENDKFSHTYPERFWPKFANEGEIRPNGRQVFVPHNGIRYEYGDLMDVVNLLVRSPLTRQAYLPVWFPEDTGTVHGKRVPCTLGYHFMIRNQVLSMRYYMRSCDLIRHFTDDVYLAGRLMQWMAEEIRNRQCPYYQDLSAVCDHEHLEVGQLVMHIASLHAFQGDKYKLDQIIARDREPS